MISFFSRLRSRWTGGAARVAIAERFRCDVDRLAGIELPLQARPSDARQIDVLIRDPASGASRQASWSLAGPEAGGSGASALQIPFAPMAVVPGAILDLAVAFDAQSTSAGAIWQEFARMAAADREPIALPCLSPRAGADAAPLTVTRFWCDKNGLFAEGELARSAGTIRSARIVAGDDSAELQVTSLAGERSAFSGYLPWRAGTPVWLVLSGDTGASTLPLVLPRGDLPAMRWNGRNEWDETLVEAMAVDQVDESPAAVSFKHFIRSADAPSMTVAEVGGRVVGDASQSMRRFVPNAHRFISVDIHASEHVDVVGDAHYLDELLGPESVDAIFSLSVMEHLAYPWLFASAVNRALKPGGLVFQSTPNTWPLHETPNDFWRFSDEALKILFGPETGFEVIDAGMVNRIWLYPEERRGAFVDMPFNHGYGNAYIYARKISTLPADEVRWPVERSASSRLAQLYPQEDRASRS